MGQWLLVTLTAGVGGSMLSIGSAAGVALMGQARGMYTFFSHLRWTPVIALGYAPASWSISGSTAVSSRFPLRIDSLASCAPQESTVSTRIRLVPPSDSLWLAVTIRVSPGFTKPCSLAFSMAKAILASSFCLPR